MSTLESTEARWARIVRDQAASGLTAAAICEQRGLAISTFYPWKRRLASAAESPRAVTPAPAYVEATVHVDDPQGEHCVTIALTGGRRIAVG